MKKFIFILIPFLFGCRSEITNDDLRNKMLACSASLGEELSLSLNDHINKNFLDGKLSTDFSETMENIFNTSKDISSSDEVKLYEDYLNCIETLKIVSKNSNNRIRSIE